MTTPRALSALLRPRSVAVVGASHDTKKRGNQAVRALTGSGFAGAVYPVHPAGGELYGLRVYPSINDLPEAPDLAYICTVADLVPTIVAECARKGVPGVVIPAVGFRESGSHGERLEQAVLRIVRDNGIRVVGPNTSGLINTSIDLNLVGMRDVRPGTLSLLSQSGNVALDIITSAARRGLGIATYVGVGNETDVAFDEYVEALEHDDQTRAILMYAEGFRNGRRFIDVARRVGRSKPIVLLKGGRSDHGVAAARSHTGSIAGSYTVLRAALRQGGVCEVTRSDELLTVGHTLAHQPPLKPGTGIALLSDGGGHGTLVADALTELGTPLATLSVSTQRRLRTLLGRAANVKNPVDLAGAPDADPSIFARVLDVLARDRAVGGVIVIGLFGGYGIRFHEDLAAIEHDTAAAMAETMAARRKTLLVHSLYAEAFPPALADLMRLGVPVTGSLEVAARAMRAAQVRGLFLTQQPTSFALPAAAVQMPGAIRRARDEGRTALLETEARILLRESRIPIVEAVLCHSTRDVADATKRLAPVALKVVAPDIPHKTDAGGVALRVNSAKAAQAAFRRISRAAAEFLVANGRAPDVRGVLVTPMLPTPDVELLLGARHDTQYGPVITVGAGGTAVEIHRDIATRALPVDAEEIRAMLAELRIAPLLAGYRGKAPVNVDHVIQAIARLAAAALSYPMIEEIEINPLFVYVDRVVAVDVRATLRDWEQPAATPSTRTKRPPRSKRSRRRR